MFKKIFCTIFVVLTAVMFSGCFQSDENLSLVNNSFFTHSIVFSPDGQNITELVYTDFSKLENVTNQKKDELLGKVFDMFVAEKTTLDNEYKQLLLSEGVEISSRHQGKYSLTVLKQDDSVSFKLAFQKPETWKYFSSRNGASDRITYEYEFFTYRRVDGNSPVGAIKVVNQNDVLFGDYLKDKVKEILLEESESLANQLDQKSVYAYVTSYRRRHSNADMIGSLQGYYYHQWQMDDQINFKIYTTHPRAEIWYLFALALAFVVIGVLYLVSYIKTPKNIKANAGEAQIIIEEEPEKQQKQKKSKNTKNSKENLNDNNGEK